jgi:hypothetical protein
MKQNQERLEDKSQTTSKHNIKKPAVEAAQ